MQSDSQRTAVRHHRYVEGHPEQRSDRVVGQHLRTRHVERSRRGAHVRGGEVDRLRLLSSDSGQHPGGERSGECRQRIDCLAGLEQLYGLKFKSFHPVDIGLRYTVLEKGQADLSILFTTDPQLAAESDKFVILEDDKEVFPAGNVLFVTTDKVAEEAGPDYEKTIIQVQEGLTLEVMQELDARVELEKKSAKEVAGEYLEEAGYTG